MDIVIDARPDILNHNTETVPRLYRRCVRGRASSAPWSCSRRSSARRPSRPRAGSWSASARSGRSSTRRSAAIRGAGTDILTVGQYLRPTRQHLPVVRYYTPEEFVRLGEFALALGFRHVESGPLVRSSYHAEEQIPR